MIGAAGDAGLLRRAPIVDKFRVEAVTPFGRLDVSEMNPRIADFLPVDLALPIGNIDSLDRHCVGRGDAVMRLLVREHAGRCSRSAYVYGKYSHGNGDDRHAASTKRHQ